MFKGIALAFKIYRNVNIIIVNKKKSELKYDITLDIGAYFYNCIYLYYYIFRVMCINHA